MPCRSAPRLAAVAAALVLATACTADGDAPEAQQSTAPAGSGVSEQEQADLLERLGAVDPALATGRSVGRARNVCLAISRGADDAAVAETVRARFGTPGEDLTDEQVIGITAAVRSALCPAAPSAAPTS